MKALSILLCACLVSACAKTEDDHVNAVIGDLVAALNRHDSAGAAKLYSDGRIPAVNDNGDSSAIYRLLEITGGKDFEASDLTTVVIEDRARTTFNLSGTMTRGDSTLGHMGMRLKLELEKVAGNWRIIPGNEQKETGL